MIPYACAFPKFRRLALAGAGLTALSLCALAAPETAVAQVYFAPYFHAYAYPGPEVYYPDRGGPSGWEREPRYAPHLSRRAVSRIMANEGYRLDGPISSHGLTVIAVGVDERGRQARFAIDAEDGAILDIRRLGRAPEPRYEERREARRHDVDEDRRSRRDDDEDEPRPRARAHNYAPPPLTAEEPRRRTTHREHPQTPRHAALPPPASPAAKPPGSAPTEALTPPIPPTPAPSAAAPNPPAQPAATPANAPPPPPTATPQGSAHRAVVPPQGADAPPAAKNQPDPTVSVLVKSKSDGPSPASVVVRPPAEKKLVPPPPDGGY